MYSRVKIIAIVCGLILVCISAFYFWLYWGSFHEMAGDSKQRKCTYIKSLQFTGVISKIDRYEYSDYMYGKFLAVDITLPDHKTEHLQFELKNNPDLPAFIRLNQKAEKQLNYSSIDITDSLSITKTYVLAECEN